MAGITPNDQHTMASFPDQAIELILTVLSNPPPAGVIWITIALVVVRLLWDIVRSVYNFFEKRKTRLRSIDDEYWYRNQLLPLSLHPLIEFINGTSEKLVTLSAELDRKDSRERRRTYLDFLNERTEGKNLLLSRFRVLEVLDVHVYEPISHKLDDMEEVLIKHCYSNSGGEGDTEYAQVSSVNEFLFLALKEIVSCLIRAHRDLRP